MTVLIVAILIVAILIIGFGFIYRYIGKNDYVVGKEYYIQDYRKDKVYKKN